MAAKPRLRTRSFVLALIATAIGALTSASASLAATGAVYFDANNNAAAGDPAHLFNGTFIGTNNVGLGARVMENLTIGGANVAVGQAALQDTTSGFNNVATGPSALQHNTTGAVNVATGSAAMQQSITGGQNVATGADALRSSTAGSSNTAVGFQALFANTGDSNVALGSLAGDKLTTGSNNVDIANQGRAGESRAIRIGTTGAQRKAFLAGVSGTAIPGPTQPVLVNAKGQLGTAVAASATASAAKPLSAAAGRRLLATVKHQQRQIERQGKEIRALRAQNG